MDSVEYVKTRRKPNLTPKERIIISNVFDGLCVREKNLTIKEVVALCSMLTKVSERVVCNIIKIKKEEMDPPEPSKDDSPLELCEFIIKEEFNTIKDEGNNDTFTPTEHVCNKCGYIATKLGYLKIHMRRHVKNVRRRDQPGQETLRKCDLCNYKSKYLHDVQKHFSLVHNKGKLFKCYKCEYVALCKREWLQHKKIHLGKELFKCNDCEYHTDNKQHLIRHFYSHNKTVSFKCNSCDFKTTCNKKLHVHKLSHNEKFKCAICDACYLHKCSLKIHMKRFKHNQDKPAVFNCDQCNFTTLQEVKLIWHTRIHSGKQLFECNSCEYKTNLHCNLKKHNRVHSKQPS